MLSSIFAADLYVFLIISRINTQGKQPPPLISNFGMKKNNPTDYICQ